MISWAVALRRTEPFRRERAFLLRQKTSAAIGSHVSRTNVRARSALGRVWEVGRSPFSNRPLLSHQQTSVSRRYIEDFVDLMTVKVHSIDDVGEFSSEPDPHN
jgi:hypothetical protein